MPDVIEPDVARHAAWLDSHREWGPGLHEDGFGIGPDDDVESPEGFATWVTELRSRPEKFWWIVEREVVVGGIALRAFADDEVLRVGHIGYGVRPSARGRGVATWALGQVLQQARQTELRRVLLVCLDDNSASIKTIERRGGVLDETFHNGNALMRRYSINLEEWEGAGQRPAPSGRGARQRTDMPRWARTSRVEGDPQPRTS